MEQLTSTSSVASTVTGTVTFPEKIVSVMIHNDYEGPLRLVPMSSMNRKAAKRYPNQYRIRRIPASMRARWKAEYARFDAFHEEVSAVFQRPADSAEAEQK